MTPVKSEEIKVEGGERVLAVGKGFKVTTREGRGGILKETNREETGGKEV